jgi:hypothetical protein
MIKSKRMRWAGYITRIGEKRNAYRILFGKQEGKRTQGRPRRKWEEIGVLRYLLEGENMVVWIGLIWL